MNEGDKDIEEFFAGMRNSDSRLEVPNYDELVVKKKRVRPFAIVAASLGLVFVSSWYILTTHEESPAVEIVITKKKETGSMSLMASDGTIEEWKSPTQSLIDDF